MKVHYSIIFASLFLTINIALAEPFKPMSIPIDEELKEKSTAFEGDGVAKESFVKIEKLPFIQEKTIKMVSIDGNDYYQIKESQKLFNGQQLETLSLVEIGEYLRAISYNVSRKSPEGEEIESHEVRFDHYSWKYPADIYPITMLSLIFSTF